MTLNERRAAAIAKYREVSRELLAEAVDHDEEDQCLQALFEALNHEQGFVEGHVIMLGADDEDLSRSKQVARYAGMRECLMEHDENCSGCEASSELRRIVEAN